MSDRKEEKKKIKYIVQKSFLMENFFQSSSISKNPLDSPTKTPSLNTVHCLSLRVPACLPPISECNLHKINERCLHPKLAFMLPYMFWTPTAARDPGSPPPISSSSPLSFELPPPLRNHFCFIFSQILKGISTYPWASRTLVPLHTSPNFDPYESLFLLNFARVSLSLSWEDCVTCYRAGAIFKLKVRGLENIKLEDHVLTEHTLVLFH